jgi:2-polyprenyl-6-methoxyphenol hydroxylase-like FAD-dependent oxidoreductase
MAKIGNHAVVLGASMAGLLAARALADFFETVTVVERDVQRAASANHRRRQRSDSQLDQPLSLVESTPV